MMQHQDKKHSKRVMTSAIPNMSVAEVRRCLSLLRKHWRESTPVNPFYLSDILSETLSMEEFALLFVRGHHDKRHNKKIKQESLSTSKYQTLMNPDDFEQYPKSSRGSSFHNYPGFS